MFTLKNPKQHHASRCCQSFSRATIVRPLVSRHGMLSKLGVVKRGTPTPPVHVVVLVSLCRHNEELKCINYECKFLVNYYNSVRQNGITSISGKASDIENIYSNDIPRMFSARSAVSKLFLGYLLSGIKDF